MKCMRIESIELENFRGIRTGKIDQLGSVNVLIGRNNSGRSSILEALALFRVLLEMRNLMEDSTLNELLIRRISRETVDTEGFLYNHEGDAAIKLEFDNQTEIKFGYQ